MIIKQFRNYEGASTLTLVPLDWSFDSSRAARAYIRTSYRRLRRDEAISADLAREVIFAVLFAAYLNAPEPGMTIGR